MTERERNAVEALKRLLNDVKDDGTISPSMLSLEFAADALAAYGTPGSPPMVPWDEFVKGKSFMWQTRECAIFDETVVGYRTINEGLYNALRNALKGGA